MVKKWLILISLHSRYLFTWIFIAMPTVSVDIKAGQAVRITAAKQINPFIAVGKMVKDKGFNFAEVMCKLSPVAHKVFWEMVQLRDENTNKVHIDSKLNTNSQNSIISKGYKVLVEHELLLKIGKGTYMINPYAVLPTMSLCKEVNLEWNKLYHEYKNKKG